MIFDIENGLLRKYLDMETDVTVPDGVTEIGITAFAGRCDLISVELPEGVTCIGPSAFYLCSNLRRITIPGSVTRIEDSAFRDCVSLTSVTIPNGISEIERDAFRGCTRLAAISLPDSGIQIGADAFRDTACFLDRTNREDGVLYVGRHAIDVDKEASGAIRLRQGTLSIGSEAFSGCRSLTSVTIPDSVLEISDTAFQDCLNATFVCGEATAAHRHCARKRLNYIFDYQFEAFHGVLPPGIERLGSPFQADEAYPFVFVSYSHKDRDAVLQLLKPLYEAGWRIWYDEGLTVGDAYDHTLEAHVKSCSAVLLFLSKNALESRYIRELELPWANAYGKPIIQCALETGAGLAIEAGNAAATVSPSGIEAALEAVDGLTKGERRTAKGLTVLADPAVRNRDGSDRFAYCVYAEASSAAARSILLEADNNGCRIYDAVQNGPDPERLRTCAALIVFLDPAFLADDALTALLVGFFRERRDVAVCQIGALREDDLPHELSGLCKLHWLDYVNGIATELHLQLAGYLQGRGCRDASVLPGLSYRTTDDGIVITRYTGAASELRIERRYGRLPVVGIANRAFKGCSRLQTVVLPESVTEIGWSAFADCAGLRSLTIPDSVAQLQENAFENCIRLSSITLPHGLTVIADGMFLGCAGLTAVAIPNGVRELGSRVFEGCASLRSILIPEGVPVVPRGAFRRCASLSSILLPDSVLRICSYAFQDCAGLFFVLLPARLAVIEQYAFDGCVSLMEITIPNGVSSIEKFAFSRCASLTSVTIPNGVRELGDWAFSECTRLASVYLPDSLTEIGRDVFLSCPHLTVFGSKGSCAEQYAKAHGLPFRAV